MTRLRLVRHARPASSFEEHLDAPLDEVGRQQAEAVAVRLAPVGPLPVVTSPRRRARETAAPLAGRWGTEAVVVDAMGEIPSPSDDLEARGRWLREVLARRWDEVDPELRAWRGRLLGALADLGRDSVVFTHYVAINTVVGAATEDDRLTCCRPGHASVTEIEIGPDGRFVLVAQDEASASTEAAPR